MTTAVVTGAGGALGRAIALRFVADGHAVALTDIHADNLATTLAEVRAAGGTASAEVVDLADSGSVERFFAATHDRYGPLDVLVNNAAIYPSRPFLEVPLAEYDQVHAVNQRGYWLCAQLAARQMATACAGAIVNVASITMHGILPLLAAYVTTKGAAASMTRALARELGPLGIRVNAVAPGAFPTAAEEIHGDLEAYNTKVLGWQSLKRRGTPTELAAVVSFLAGPDAAFVTGQTIDVDGGWVMA
ncbi:MAG TPA: SDR family oxidoreductase [Pseudonocardiaceae bacterium]|nr:SDR family oxidoreductase [Pseudonocardiaceae bacterium]